MTYTILETDGTRRPWNPQGRRPVLKELQEIVGGYIERVRLPVQSGTEKGRPSGSYLWVNEDGISRGLPVNVAASQLAGQMILGRALWCSRARRKGDA